MSPCEVTPVELGVLLWQLGRSFSEYLVELGDELIYDAGGSGLGIFSFSISISAST